MTVVDVELTDAGYLRLTAPVAATYFPSDAMVAVPRGRELWLMPLSSQDNGGLLLKQRNADGDRSALVHEVLPVGWPVGHRSALWDEAAGALRIDLSIATSPDHGARRGAGG
jgi:hydrogenase maturation protease